MAAAWYEALNRSITRPTASAQTERPTPPAVRPLQGSGTTLPGQSRGFSQRGFPEAIQAEDYVPEGVTGELGGIPGALDTAMRSPAMVGERGLAFADTLASSTGMIDEGASLLDPVSNFFQDLPIVGEHLDNAGKIAESAFESTFSEFNLIAQPHNAAMAYLWDGTKDNEEDEGLGLFSELVTVLKGFDPVNNLGGIDSLLQFVNPWDSITKGELRELYHKKGWTDQDLEDVETGRKGWMDFSDKPLDLVGPLPKGAEDFLLRGIGDPLNLAMGVGVISKAGKVFKAGDALASGIIAGNKGARSAAIARAYRVQRAPFLTPKALNVAQGTAKFAEGSVAGVTQTSAAKVILDGSAKWGKRYLKTSVGLTGLQVGMNTIDELATGDKERGGGWLGNVFDFAAKWGDHKPLSKNDLFAMYSIMKTPGRTIANKSTKPLRDKRAASRQFNHENQLAEMLHPELVVRSVKGGIDYGPAKAEVLSRLGGQAAMDAAVGHLVKATLNRKNFLEGIASLPRLFHVTSMAESGAVVERYNKVMGDLLKETLEAGGLKRRDIRASVEEFTATRGGNIENATAGVKGQFRADDFYETWRAWEPQARKTSAAFQDGVAVRPALSADMVLEDGVDWILARLALKKSSMVTGDDLLDILRVEPGLFELPGADAVITVLTRDGGGSRLYDVKPIRQWLNEVRTEHAIPRHEYVAGLEQWEGLSRGTQNITDFHNSRIGSGQALPDNINPDVTDAATTHLPLADAKAAVAVQTERGGAGVNIVRAMRDTVETSGLRYNVVAGLRAAGYDIKSAVDTVSLIGGRSGRNGMAVPGMKIRLGPERPFQDGLAVGAMILKRSNAKRSTTVLRGKAAIQTAGVAENATEITYQIGKKTDSQYDDLINKLNDQWGDRIDINDTTGAVKVLLPDTQHTGGLYSDRLKNMDKLLGGRKATDRVAYRDVLKRKRDAHAGAIEGSDYVTLKSVVRDDTYNRAFAAEGYIDLGLGGYNGAGIRARGASAAEQARAEARGNYPDATDGTPRHSTPTIWESEHGGIVRGSAEEYLVPNIKHPQTRALWEGKIQQGGTRTSPRGGAFDIAPGDTVYRSKSATANVNDAGVIVRADGEIIPWSLDPKNLPDDYHAVLAEATREGSWARFADVEGANGISPVDVLGQHGYVPAVRSRVTTSTGVNETVYLLYDPDSLGYKGGLALNGRKWADVKHEHPSMLIKNNEQRAYNQTLGFAESLRPERAVRMEEAAARATMEELGTRIDDLDRQIADKQSQLTEIYAAQDAAATDVAGSWGRSTAASEASDSLGRTRSARQLNVARGEILPDDVLASLGIKDADDIAALEEFMKKNAREGYKQKELADLGLEWRDLSERAEALRVEGYKVANGTSTRGQLQMGRKFTDDPTYSGLVSNRNALVAEHAKLAGPMRRQMVFNETVNPGRVLFVEGAEKSVENFKPYLDESIGGHLDSLPPGEIDKLYALEADLRMSGTLVDAQGKLVDAANYKLRKLPKQATPYGVDTGPAYAAMVKGRIAAEDGWRTTTTSVVSQASDMMFGRVYAIEMAESMRQEVYNELLNKGATVGEVNKFLRALQDQWELRTSIMGAKPFRSAGQQTPGYINKLARGQDKASKIFSDGFSEKVLATNPDFADIVQRAGSRTFRNLAKKYPAQDGRGNLQGLIETFYGKEGGTGAGTARGVRRGLYAGGVSYNVLRFILDPRWYVMNAFESDILGMARWGSKVRGIAGGKARNGGIFDHMRGKDPSVPRDGFVERSSPRRKDSELLSVDEILHANSGASGWMDPRNLYGYVAQAARVERPRITGKIFQEMIDDGSPVIDDLRARHGDNQAAWFDEIDETLYSIDKRGAKRTVLENELAQIMINDPALGPQYEAVLTNIWKQQRQMFQDVTHTFHGNINRANSERLLNSPLLWWPLSYQLKTGKWLVDVMTKGMAGLGPELAGTAFLGKLMNNHSYQMENNDEYRQMFIDHPALFRGLAMLLPITPFDMGVFMARWTRYAGSWTGAQLGLWDQDSSYPQDPVNFGVRSLSLGPIYSWDLFDDIYGELTDKKDDSLDRFRN